MSCIFPLHLVENVHAYLVLIVNCITNGFLFFAASIFELLSILDKRLTFFFALVIHKHTVFFRILEELDKLFFFLSCSYLSWQSLMFLQIVPTILLFFWLRKPATWTQVKKLFVMMWYCSFLSKLLKILIKTPLARGPPFCCSFFTAP